MTKITKMLKVNLIVALVLKCISIIWITCGMAFYMLDHGVMGFKDIKLTEVGVMVSVFTTIYAVISLLLNQYFRVYKARVK